MVITSGNKPYSPSQVDPADSKVADIISTVEFDHTGNYLATGDKGGRVVLFERNETVSSWPRRLGTDGAVAGHA